MIIQDLTLYVLYVFTIETVSNKDGNGYYHTIKSLCGEAHFLESAMSKYKHATECIRAGKSEEAIFLNMIDHRVSEFLDAVSLDKPDQKIAEDFREWLEVTREKIKKAFSDWYRDKVEGKDIPKDVVIPRPKEDRVYSKFGAIFADKQCEVCGDRRVLNIAHIIPRAADGPDEEWNLMRLCANHHYLFDNMHLNEGEWNSINWASKDQRARDYIIAHQLRAHRRFWQEVK